MGNGTSKTPEYTVSLAVFTPHEQQQVSKIFLEICEANPTAIMFRLANTGLAAMGRSEKEKKKERRKDDIAKTKNGFGNSHLRQYLEKYLSLKFIDRLFREMAAVGNANNVKEKVFVVALSNILKGSLEQRAHVIRKLANENEAASPEDIMELTEELLTSYISLCQSSTNLKAWKGIESNAKQVHKLARAMAHELFYPQDKHHTLPRTNIPADLKFNESEVEKWISRSPLFLHVMDLVFHACFNVSYVDGGSSPWLVPKIPFCYKVPNWNEFRTLLDIPSLLMLNSYIPPEFQKKWRLLFSSRVHGENFAKFIGNIQKQGPSLLVIRDKDRHVFGGFAADSWAITPDFYGTHRSFLYTLEPSMGVYMASGLNQHYLYLNQAQQTLPNGLGMGGQLNYYGLWLDRDNYGIGHSKAEPSCTTFNSPQLSGKSDFEIEDLEVWGVGPEPGEDEEENVSILDSDPGAKALLELAGKCQISEGLRDNDPKAASPEQHHLPYDKYQTAEG